MTQFGRELLPYLEDVPNAQTLLIARVRHLVESERPLIRIGVAMVHLLTPPDRRDNLMIEIIFRGLTLAEIVRMLKIGQLDFVFGPVDMEAPMSASLHAIALHAEDLVLVPMGAAAGQRDALFNDIAANTFIMVPDD